jgi:hypothetical protein
MDPTSVGGRVRTWVQERFPGRGTIPKDELVAEARRSDLAQEVVSAIEELPEGSWDPDRAVHRIVDILETRAGGGARGEANMPGAGGYGRSR